jgi:hypothetical protein
METLSEEKVTQRNIDHDGFDNRAEIEKLANRFKHIKGWGIDADPENEPTYPMKHYTGADHQRSNYERPPQQPVNIEVLHSNERSNVTAVFGTVSPPAGLSGAIRRMAFKYSEESLKHWFALVLADRVNVIEGIVDDIKRRHVPNIFSEMGWNAEWKYNKKGVVKKVIITTAVTMALVMYLRRKKSRA